MKRDDAERFAVSAAIRFPETIRTCGVSEEHFADRVTLRAWRAATETPASSRTETGALPWREIASRGGLDDSDMRDLMRFTCYSPEQAREYLSRLRKIVALERLRDEIRALADYPPATVEEMTARLESIARARRSDAATSCTVTLESLEEAWLQDKKREAATGRAAYPSSGFQQLDARLAGGLRPGELTTLFSGAGIGKTTFALQVARAVSKCGANVLFVSGEMTGEQIGERALSSEAGMQVGISRPDLSALADAMSRLVSAGHDRRIHVDRRFRTSPGQVIAEAHRVASSGGGLGLVIYDHLRHMDVGISRSDFERLSLAIAAAKEIAKSLPVHVLMLTHRNRGEKGTERPSLDGIKGSSNIGDDSDNVLALWRDVLDEHSPMTELLILKARQTGKTGKIDLTYRPDVQQYKELPS